jgi:hypothetical protein
MILRPRLPDCFWNVALVIIGLYKRRKNSSGNGTIELLGYSFNMFDIQSNGRDGVFGQFKHQVGL